MEATGPSDRRDPVVGAAGLVLSASGRVLRAPLLGEVRHGFTTRLGGVSEGRFASLNLGVSWGDDPGRVARNFQLLGEEAGFGRAEVCQVVQVHGTEVVTVAAPEHRQRQADGLATSAPLPLGVLSADCVSLLLSDGQGRVAAAHAGWRGTVAGMAGSAVQALVRLGARERDIRVALGPSIGPCCFEVQEDVAERFAQVVPEALVRPRSRPPSGRPRVDLWTTNRVLLLRAGVLPGHIAAAPPCTRCDERLYFSYRRDGAGIGQHLAYIIGGSP